MKDKKATSIKLTKTLIKRIMLRMTEENYGLRSRSIWIEEAIEKFLMSSAYKESTQWELTIESQDPTKTVSLAFSDNTIDCLNKAATEIRKEFPEQEVVIAKIIRAAIIHRLMQSAI